MTTSAPDPNGAGLGRKVVFALLLVGLLAIAALVYFLLTFDLNDYRTELEARLEDHLQEPVEIGSIRYQMQNGALGLRLQDVRVGNEASTFQAAVDEARLELLWRHLWQGQLRFGTLALDSPRLEVPWPETALADIPDYRLEDLEGLLARLPFRDITLRSIRIRNGSLRLSKTPEQAISVSQFEVHLSGLTSRRQMQLSLGGNLHLAAQQQAAPFRIQADLDPGLLLTGDPAGFEVNLEMTALDLARVRAWLPADSILPTAQGSVDLQFEAAREAGRPIHFRASVQSPGLAFEGGDNGPPPLLIRGLQVAGSWQGPSADQRIDELVVDLDRGRLAGSVAWSPDQRPKIELHLTAGELPVAQILAWRPTFPVRAEAFVTHLQADRATVQITQALVVSPSPGAEEDRTWRLQSFTGRLNDLAWTLPDAPGIHLDQAGVEYRPTRVNLTDGVGRLGTEALTFSGSLALEAGRITESSLQLESTLPSETVLSLLDSAIPTDGLTVNGKVPFRAELQGHPAQLKFNLLAKLPGLNLSSDNLFRLAGQPGDYLSLNGAPSETGLEIEHADFQWAGLQGHFNGAITTREQTAWQLDGLVTLSDLAALSRITSLAADLRLHGQADLDYSLSGTTDALSTDLTLTLRDAGLDIGGAPIGDLSRINGRIKLSRTSLAADRLQGYVGESSFTAGLRIDDFAHPQLVVTVEAPRIRAKDLIFPAESMMLHDVRGTIVIDRNGLQFTPVRLRLEQGTEPVVRGRVEFSDPPVAELDISADFAVIDEVINLWIRPRLPAAADRPQKRPRRADADRSAPRITINARVTEGRLYGMQFHEATGLIRPVDGQLVIHPLDFHIDEGFCNAQVLVNFSGGKAPLLRVSGHVEDVDALAIYQELLRRENIVRGRLRGDFYLQGRVGKAYLPSSYGRFKVEIEDGVLHRFKVLSKVFSLLNVSQLITFQLPDMDREGMPYRQLTANFALEGGQLSTTDLVIRSEAMNQAYQGSLDLVERQIDMVMAIHPLGTVDKLVSRVPIAGWLLTGKDQALVTAHFSVKGPVADPRVTPVPITSLSSKTIGLLRRTLNLPFKLFDSPQILWGGQDEQD